MDTANNTVKPTIWPYRVVPFDIGTAIDQASFDRIVKHLEAKNWVKTPIESFAAALGGSCMGRFTYRQQITLYIYQFGIGVFIFCDKPFYVTTEHFAIAYCEERRQAHASILSACHPYSALLDDAVSAARAGLHADKTLSIRKTAMPSWNPNNFPNMTSGLLYVMTFCWCDVPSLEQAQPGTPGFVDLTILLQPSLAQREDSTFQRFMPSRTDDEIYQLDSFQDLPMPHNWSEVPDFSIYMSWAAVLAVPATRTGDGRAAELLMVMEANLQAMWMYTYCLTEDLRETSPNTLRLTRLVEERNTYKFSMLRFRSIDDASAPNYVTSIQKGLINTSGITQQEELLETTFSTLEDAVKAYNARRRTVSDQVSELLLFALALTQLPSMLYSFYAGEYGAAAPALVVIMIVLALIYLLSIRKSD